MFIMYGGDGSEFPNFIDYVASLSNINNVKILYVPAPLVLPCSQRFELVFLSLMFHKSCLNFKAAFADVAGFSNIFLCVTIKGFTV